MAWPGFGQGPVLLDRRAAFQLSLVQKPTKDYHRLKCVSVDKHVF